MLQNKILCVNFYVIRICTRQGLNLIMENQEAKFGFTQFAETWNGRLAMMGFVIGLATELLTGQGILSQIGLM